MSAVAERVELLCIDCRATFHVAPRRGMYPLRCDECRGYVIADCEDCGQTWRMRGDGRTSPPERCADCGKAKAAADKLARLALRKGLRVAVVRTDRGWEVHTATPWHDRPVRLDDEADVRFLRCELSEAA